MTNFYDDFTIIEVEALAANARDTVEEILALLGWRLKELADFASEASPLGAVLNLDRCRDGIATITNKASRVDEIIAAIDAAGSTAKVPVDLLPRLRGRLLFARSLSFGRCGGVALRALGAAIESNKTLKTIVIDGQLARALFDLRQHLLGARPREIRVAHPSPLLFFVDGAFEPNDDGTFSGSIGGLILDPVDRSFEFFRLRISADHLALLLGAAKTAIFQLELLPVLVGRRLWSERFRDRAFLCFCDNEAAKSALVAGYSPDPIAVQILAMIADLDVVDGALGWFDRVPTASNPADAPSRLLVPDSLPDWNNPIEKYVDSIADDVLNNVRATALEYNVLSGADGRAFAAGVQ